MISFETHSAKQTHECGRLIARYLKPGDVLAFTGNLAAGKTTMIKGVCEVLKVRQNVDSPTFTLVNEYNGKYPVFHIDCYREQRIIEWLELGIQEYLYGNGVSLVEWADGITPLLPPSTIHIKIGQVMENETLRQILIEAGNSIETGIRNALPDIGIKEIPMLNRNS